MKSLGIVPGVEDGTAFVNHGEIGQEIILIIEILSFHCLMKPFDSPVLFGTVGIRKVVRNPCILEFLVEVKEILTSIVCIDGHDGKRKEGLEFPNEVSTGR